MPLLGVLCGGVARLLRAPRRIAWEQATHQGARWSCLHFMGKQSELQQELKSTEKRCL